MNICHAKVGRASASRSIRPGWASQKMTHERHGGRGEETARGRAERGSVDGDTGDITRQEKSVDHLRLGRRWSTHGRQLAADLPEPVTSKQENRNGSLKAEHSSLLDEFDIHIRVGELNSRRGRGLHKGSHTNRKACHASATRRAESDGWQISASDRSRRPHRCRTPGKPAATGVDEPEMCVDPISGRTANEDTSECAAVAGCFELALPGISMRIASANCWRATALVSKELSNGTLARVKAMHIVKSLAPNVPAVVLGGKNRRFSPAVNGSMSQTRMPRSRPDRPRISWLDRQCNGRCTRRMRHRVTFQTGVPLGSETQRHTNVEIGQSSPLQSPRRTVCYPCSSDVCPGTSGQPSRGVGSTTVVPRQFWPESPQFGGK